MNINIESLKFKTDSKLVDFIEKKVSKFEKLNEDITAVDIILKLEKNEEDKNKVFEIFVSLDGHKLFSEKKSDTFEDACLEAVDAIKSQIEKLKKD
jgi:ribosomal subunit interface protein